MLTSITIRNFKRFDDVHIELGSPVVFIGPNNSGKTTALQALTLFQIGLKRWLEKREGASSPEKRSGVPVNRRDLISLPTPAANLLWNQLHTHNSEKVGGKAKTMPVRIEIILNGIDEGESWECGLEFDYANTDSVYCRPLRKPDKSGDRMVVPEQVKNLYIAFLPPMSGLASTEVRLDPGAIQVKLGEGLSAEVLRNLCYQLYVRDDEGEAWLDVKNSINELFGVCLGDPRYVQERGEIEMSYKEGQTELDLSSAGRGLQQTLLLLSYLAVNRGAVLLLDEPDAHLEILRQRQIYQLLSDFSSKYGSQVIAASHSEVVLNEAADRDVVVAFLGRPHRIDDRGSQLLKSLKEIGFDQYYQAEQCGWVLYLEGSTDLAMLRAFAELLGHAAGRVLDRPFVHYVLNKPSAAKNHFYGLREAKDDLVGYALFDGSPDITVGPEENGLVQCRLKKRELENYIVVSKEVMMRWPAHALRVFGGDQPSLYQEVWERTFSDSIDELVNALDITGKGDPWGANIKVTDDFLDRLFDIFFNKMHLENQFRKTDYHRLVKLLDPGEVDSEIIQVLDAILEVAGRAGGGADGPVPGSCMS